MKLESYQGYCSYLQENLKNRHLSRALLFTDETFFFHLSGKKPERLVIALLNDNPLVYLAASDLAGKTLETPFFLLLKKYFNNSYLEKVSQVNNDKILRFDLTIINAVYKEESIALVIELLPHHPNLILLDQDNKVLGAFHTESLDSPRPLYKNMLYVAPAKNFKVMATLPFDEEAFLQSSLVVEEEIFKKRKQERFGYLLTYFSHREKLLQKKSKILEGDILQAKKHIDDGLYGDYLYMNQDQIDPKQGFFLYEGKKIPLCAYKSLSNNATNFYRQAKKAKSTLLEAHKNLLEAQKELEEITASLDLLNEASEEGLESLASTYSWLKPHDKENLKKHSTSSLATSLLPYYVDVKGTKILFGKSSHQNDCLTFLLDTAKNHYWFHVLGTSGSHVMIKKENPTPEEKLVAEEIALLNSSLEDGSVLVALRGDVYKGAVSGQAIVKKSETVTLKKVREETKQLLKGALKYNFERK